EAVTAALIGRSIFDIEELHTLHALADRPLRCAVEMACWDLVGRALGQPLCHLFGGGYRSWIPVAVRLSSYQPDHIVQHARELAEQGFHCQIVPSTGRPESDVQTLLSVRQGIGDLAELRFDGASRYDLGQARRLSSELEAVGLRFFLDPLRSVASGEPTLHGAGLEEIASLGRQTNLPLAAWRAIGGPADVLAMVRCGAAPYVVIDLGQVGGLTPGRKCATVAEAAGITVLLGGRPSLGIGTAAMLQLAASAPTFSSSNECAYHQLQDDVLVDPLEIVDGMIGVPQSPGLGIEVDRAKVERYQVT
ncbi:MAG TPA: enolase C-terminal domain-like protein, partial [Thermoguttaceae bacterium]|nr:enolase C-terminal domain-like protein [Thermoguttaceae bacterium]